MTWWKEYYIEKVTELLEEIKFDLDGDVWYRMPFEIMDYETKRYIRCPRTYPFNTWQVDDLIEVDNHKTEHMLSCLNTYGDGVRMKRKAALSSAMSSSLVPCSASSSVLSLASEELTRGKDNFECKIENHNGGYEKIAYNRGSWRYEKTSFGN